MTWWQVGLILIAFIVVAVSVRRYWGDEPPAAPPTTPLAAPDFILYPGVGYPASVLAHLGAPNYDLYPQQGFPAGTRLP